MDEQNTSQATVPSTEPVTPNTTNPLQSVQPVSVPQSTQALQPQPSPVQQVPQPNPGYVPQSSPMQSFTTPQQPKKKKTALIIIIVLLLLLISGGVFAYMTISNSKEESDTVGNNVSELEKSPSATTDSQVADITAQAGGETIKANLLAFFNGGSSNDKQYPENKYYPSEKDMIDASWVQKNLTLPPSVLNGLSDGTYAYKATGCDSSMTASKQNACSSFTITVKQSNDTTATITSS